MIWSECLKLSCFSTTKIFQQNDNDLDYIAVSYLNDFDKELFGDILYFATFDQWEKLRHMNNLSFILLEEPLSTPDKFFPSNNTNILSFNEKQDFLSFYGLLQTELSIERIMNAKIQELFSMVADNMSLQKIVDKISEVYKRPVTVVDNSFSIIASSQNYFFPDSTLSDAVQRGHLLTVARNYLKKMSILNPKGKIVETIVLNPDVKIDNKKFTNYFTYIYINNINVGSFSVLEIGDNPIPENKLRYLPQIASIFSEALQKKNFYVLNKANYYTHLFASLLGEQNTDNCDIDERLQQFGYNLKRYKYIICVNFQYMHIVEIEIQSLADKLLNFFENSFYMIAEDSILYFVSRDEENLITQKEVNDWNNTLDIKSINIKIGVSSAFENPNHAKQNYNDSKEAIVIGKRYDPNKKIYLYDDYRIDNIIHILANHIDISSLCYPSLIRLIAYDQSKGTNLSYTLLKFLENPKNPLQVCKSLYIHKNTLYYRLNRISSIMGSSFERANEIAQIKLTFAILKYQGRFTPSLIKET